MPWCRAEPGRAPVGVTLARRYRRRPAGQGFISRQCSAGVAIDSAAEAAPTNFGAQRRQRPFWPPLSTLSAMLVPNEKEMAPTAHRAIRRPQGTRSPLADARQQNRPAANNKSAVRPLLQGPRDSAHYPPATPPPSWSRCWWKACTSTRSRTARSTTPSCSNRYETFTPPLLCAGLLLHTVPPALFIARPGAHGGPQGGASAWAAVLRGRPVQQGPGPRGRRHPHLRPG